MCTINEDHTMYGSWDKRHDEQSLFFFCQSFLPFDLPNNTKNQNFEKIKKILGDIIILHLCITNYDRIMYGPWDTVHDRHNFPLFRDIFCPFTSLETWKIKILKKWRNVWRYYRFTHVYQKWKSYHVWFLRYGTRRTEFFVILDHFLPFYPTNNPENNSFAKIKKGLEILSYVQHKWQ